MLLFLDKLPTGAEPRHGKVSAFGRMWRVDYAPVSDEGSLEQRIVITGVETCSEEVNITDDVDNTEAGRVFNLLTDHMFGNTQLTIRCMTAGTDFQKRVWKALADIPAGQTETYGAIAARIGFPQAVRAVGTAVGRNPIGLLIPCHRVVPADTRQWPGNYAWGRTLKRQLLEAESIQSK